MKLGAIAQALDLRLEGDPDQEIRRVATIQSAGAGELCFLANDRYRSFLAESRAGAVVLGADMAVDCQRPALISNNPYADYARAAKLLHPEPAEMPGIHDTASVDAAAEVGEGVHVGPMAVIEGPVRLGEGVSIAAGAIVSGDVWIGAGSRVGSGVVIGSGTRLGERCIVHGGVVIGADGFGFAPDQGEWVKVPQLGGVSIGSDVELGANTTVDRGAIDDTVIEDGVKLDNQVQVAHNVRIERGTVIAGCTAVAGSTRIGRGCMIAGGVGIAGHLEIADGTVVTAMTLVSRSIREPGVYSGSLPMDDGARWKKNSARFRKLDELARRVRKLERALSDRGDTEK